MIPEVITVVIDRPYGSRHPKHPDLIYTVNYGYVEGIIAGDGEEQDAYVLGISEPLDRFTGRVIALIHRCDDAEDKWVVAPEGITFTPEQIAKATAFQEKYFKSEIIMI